MSVGCANLVIICVIISDNGLNLDHIMVHMKKFPLFVFLTDFRNGCCCVIFLLGFPRSEIVQLLRLPPALRFNDWTNSTGCANDFIFNDFREMFF